MTRLELTESQLKEELLVWQMKERLTRYNIEILFLEGGSSATLGKLLEEVSSIQEEIAIVEATLKDKGVKMYSGKEALLIIEDMEKREYYLEDRGFEKVSIEKEGCINYLKEVCNFDEYPTWYIRLLEDVYGMAYKEGANLYNTRFFLIEDFLPNSDMITYKSKFIDRELTFHVREDLVNKVKEVINPYKKEYCLGSVEIQGKLVVVKLVEKEPLDIDFSPESLLKQKLQKESLEVLNKIRELDYDTRESKDREHTHLLRLSSDIMEEYLDTLRERLKLLEE